MFTRSLVRARNALLFVYCVRVTWTTMRCSFFYRPVVIAKLICASAVPGRDLPVPQTDSDWIHLFAEVPRWFCSIRFVGIRGLLSIS